MVEITLMRRAAAEHEWRAVCAHRPRQLRVLVNGFEVATHEINGTATRVTQTVSCTEPVWLVEVYSEQDVCMASLDVWPLPEAAAEQRAAVALADDRRVEIALSFLRRWPTLHLVYEDPANVQTEAEERELRTHPIASTSSATSAATAASAGSAGSTSSAVSALDAPHALNAPRWRGWPLPTLRRPPRLAWSAAMAVIAWLVFFTPGTSVSAAERIWRAIVAIVGSELTPALAPIPGGGPARQRDIPLPASPKPRGQVSSSPSAATPDAHVLPELEIDVLTALQARQELSGQRIQVTRTTDGVTVEGLVEGGNRAELVRALRALPHGAILRVDLTTPADLMGTGPAPGASGASTPSSLRAVALGRDAIPVADDLRRAIVSRDGEAAAPAPESTSAPAAGSEARSGSASRAGAAIENVETAVHRISNEGLRHARAAFLEAVTLSTLAERFDAARASGMSVTTMGKWRALVKEQVDRVTRAVDRLRALLEPVFLTYDERTAPRSPQVSVSAPPSPDGSRAGDRLGPAGAARRIAEELRQVEHVTRAALAVAEVAPATIELRERSFWRRLAATSDRIAALGQQLMAR